MDAYPWPCADARLNLLAGFHGRLLALNLYLAPLFVEALTDLSAVAPDLGDPPDPRVIFERFMGWVPRRSGGAFRDRPRPASEPGS
ncbi:hypothetical protein OG792_32725 [Micromonospora sp. NBC_01699]|uniref:hypothetical protein n=1 Tax=Micromonospora sp. NBC_01699 TaxID=2975984 RepID=UPI002E2985AE|nr:hypothetical protein [Micromonospora sp. NBC_01699]